MHAWLVYRDGRFIGYAYGKTRHEAAQAWLGGVDIDDEILNAMGIE
jgi:hypothetical protein